MSNDALWQIVWVVLGLMIVWVVLQAILKLAAKVFACGCSVILAIGVIIFLVQWLGGS